MQGNDYEGCDAPPRPAPQPTGIVHSFFFLFSFSYIKTYLAFHGSTISSDIELIRPDLPYRVEPKRGALHVYERTCIVMESDPANHQHPHTSHSSAKVASNTFPSSLPVCKFASIAT